eukprot:scaffold13182_cov64-Attheya_sp.AAC.7
MFRDSEQTGENGCDPGLFRVATKYAALLYATTNSYKYLRILADFQVQWHCYSDADQAIYDAFLFAATTVNGKNNL